MEVHEVKLRIRNNGDGGWSEVLLVLDPFDTVQKNPTDVVLGFQHWSCLTERNDEPGCRANPIRI
jgi:hypothetical protein